MAGYFAVVGPEQTSGYPAGAPCYYSSTASSPYEGSLEPYADGTAFPPRDMVMNETFCYAGPYHNSTPSQSPCPWDGRPATNPATDSYHLFASWLFADLDTTTPDRGSPAQAISACPSLSPDSPCDERETPSSMPPTRKRGRPRLHHSRDTAPSPQRSTCLPHKQVERKYREGLNMEFERLRRAVPTLPQSMDVNVMGASKPSKGTVLAAAIEYITRVERERDDAVRELEMRRAEGRSGFV